MSISTEGLARACAAHPKRTLGAWLVAVLVSFVVIALLLGDALTSDGDVTSNPESKQAESLIHESFPPEPTPSEIVVVRSDRYTVDEPAFQERVQALGARAAGLDVAAEARSFSRARFWIWRTTAATSSPKFPMDQSVRLAPDAP